jgi:hypothetical protein
MSMLLDEFVRWNVLESLLTWVIFQPLIRCSMLISFSVGRHLSAKAGIQGWKWSNISV